ncbi:MAG: class I SAM-dependent methyltransferase [Polyangiaceae bacterium]
MTGEMRTADDQLAESAAFARRTAEGSCRRDPKTGESCAWYHGLWQDLRAVGLGSKVAYQAAFLAEAFAHVRGRAPRVLLSGAADDALLTNVLEACDANGLLPRVTVLDLCGTPLVLNERYAARTGRAITTVRADMCEHAPAEPYDAVVAHSFIGYSPPAERRRLIQRWGSILAPSGALILVNRVRAGDPELPLAFGAREAAAFCAAVDDRLRPSLSADELAMQLARAAAYVRNHVVYALPDGEIEGHFAVGGFDVAVTSMVTADDPRSRDVGGGVAVASNARYACIVGVRR